VYYHHYFRSYEEIIDILSHNWQQSTAFQLIYWRTRCCFDLNLSLRIGVSASTYLVRYPVLH
jgi:hypothetical protein